MGQLQPHDGQKVRCLVGWACTMDWSVRVDQKETCVRVCPVHLPLCLLPVQMLSLGVAGMYVAEWSEPVHVARILDDEGEGLDGWQLASLLQCVC